MLRRLPAVGPLFGMAAFALWALASQGAVQAAAPAYHAAPCTGDFAGVAQKVECGFLVVDETRGSDNGRRVVLPVAVVKALHPNPALPPVIYLHGGPGGSAIQSLPRMLRGSVGRELVGQDQDWIFFDQRGSKLAVPELDCGEAACRTRKPPKESCPSAHDQ